MIFAALALLLAPLIVGLFAGLFAPKSKDVGVLLFHRISKGLPLSLSQVSARQFEFFCAELARSQKRAVAFSQFTSPKDEVCICFDDGHKSVFEFAYPIIKKYGLTATVFAASGIIGKEKIEDFYSTKNMMTADNLRELSQNGWEIGSHGVRHLDLTLLDDEALAWELLNSKKELQNAIFGRDKADRAENGDKACLVCTISFPYGGWNERVIERAKEFGYEKFSVYRKHGLADGKTIIPATAIFPFDDKKDIKAKISGEIGGLTYVLSSLVPHFAKGTPMFFWHGLYGFNKK